MSARAEIAPEQLHRRVVGGRRVGQRLAREGHQPDAVARQPVHQPLRARAWRARAATGRRRCASIDFEKSSATTRSRPRCRSSLARPPAWGRASASASSASAADHAARPAASCAAPTRWPPSARSAPRPPSRASRRRRAREGQHVAPAPPPAPQQQPEQLGLSEAHGQGSRRKRVRRSAISSSSSSSAGNRKRGNSSAYSTPRSLMRDFSRSSRMFWNRSASAAVSVAR